MRRTTVITISRAAAFRYSCTLVTLTAVAATLLPGPAASLVSADALPAPQHQLQAVADDVGAEEPTDDGLGPVLQPAPVPDMLHPFGDAGSPYEPSQPEDFQTATDALEVDGEEPANVHAEAADRDAPQPQETTEAEAAEPAAPETHATEALHAAVPEDTATAKATRTSATTRAPARQAASKPSASAPAKAPQKPAVKTTSATASTPASSTASASDAPTTAAAPASPTPSNSASATTQPARHRMALYSGPSVDTRRSVVQRNNLQLKRFMNAQHAAVAADVAVKGHRPTLRPLPTPTNRPRPPAPNQPTRPNNTPTPSPLPNYQPNWPRPRWGMYPPSKANRVVRVKIPRRFIRRRAVTWEKAKVPYCQSEWYKNKYGTYRMDCSGFVSMAWAAREFYTGNVNKQSKKVTWDELLPGDAVYRHFRGNKGHIMLFMGWDTHKPNIAVMLHSTSYSGTCPMAFGMYRQGFDQDALIENKFIPIRYDRVVEDR